MTPPAFDSDVPIVIATCDRHPQYIDQTVRSMYAADPLVRWHPVRLLICGDSAAYLGDVVGWVKAQGGLPPWCEPLTSVQWARVRERSGKHRTAHNLLRALSWAGSPHGEGLFLQDDLEFAPDWLGRAKAIINELARRYDERAFMLSLYAPYTLEGQLYAVYPAERFYGMQAMYMNEAAALGLHAFMHQELTVRGAYRPDDLLVKDYLMEHGVPLYAANPSLVQHIGIVSAIEQRYHESPSFGG